MIDVKIDGNGDFSCHLEGTLPDLTAEYYVIVDQVFDRIRRNLPPSERAIVRRAVLEALTKCGSPLLVADGSDG